MDFRLVTGTPLAGCFIVAAFSLAGMPPFSGFFGKLGVFQAAFESAAWVGLVLLVVASVFTLASMLKIWSFAFQRTPGDSEQQPGSRVGAVPLFAMILLILGLGFAAGPVQEYSTAAADALLDSSGYDEAVLSASGRLTPRGIR
jgi:multicomponent Na+:H+ antiporter subunit D